ncbi:ribose-5-phosphate isomerase RpiA [Pedobacter sp. AW31-3R]|uniref:ribose-5-phosphate isomerase RpiA n=1 Tax=Pedobacter sp. AW31-3R TaxID=3445781 RepID=UPI003F9F7907
METQSLDIKDLEKKIAALEAVKYIKNNDVVGLGTGSTAFFAIEAVAELVKNGLMIKCVPTSEHTAKLAASLGIALLDMDEVSVIDITIDGADEFDGDLNLIKGGGGAHFREKIIACLTKKEVIIADSAKQVERLGKFKVPVEVVPMALNYVKQELRKLNGLGEVRMKNGTPFITDNHNYIIDADFGFITHPEVLSENLNQIEGILAHGLFVNMASVVIMGKGNETVTFNRS